MTTQKIETDTIREFVESNLLAGRTIEADEDLLLTGLVDSLGIMTLVSHLEGLAGHAIPPEDVTFENFASISAMTEYLNRAAA